MEVFLHPRILKTDYSKYLLKGNFGPGSKSQKISAPPAPAPQHWKKFLFQADFYFLDPEPNSHGG